MVAFLATNLHFLQENSPATGPSTKVHLYPLEESTIDIL